MSSQSELYDKLSTCRKERKSGRVYVHFNDKKRRLSCISITVRKGEIIDIGDTQQRDAADVGDFWELPIRSVALLQASIPDKATKNPSVPDMDRLLDRIGGSSDGTGSLAAVSEQRTGQLAALSREIDRLIVNKRLDRAVTRGQIGLEAGVLMHIDENTPDDISKITRIKAAVRTLLGEEL